MKLGSTGIANVKLGDVDVQSIMLGDQEVWTVGEPVDDIFGDGSALHIWRFSDNVIDSIAGLILSHSGYPLEYADVFNDRALSVNYGTEQTIYATLPSHGTPVTFSYFFDPVRESTTPSGYYYMNLITDNLVYLAYITIDGDECWFNWRTVDGWQNYFLGIAPHHIALAWNYSFVEVFIDGVSLGENLVWSSDLNVYQIAIVDKPVHNGTDYFYIDNLRVFDKHITEEEAMILATERF